MCWRNYSNIIGNHSSVTYKNKIRQEQLELEQQNVMPDSKTFSYTLDDLLEERKTPYLLKKAPKGKNREDVLFKKITLEYTAFV